MSTVSDVRAEIKGTERIDEIGFDGLVLLQEPAEFCYGIDAVLLADFASKDRGKRILDLGTGTGIIPLILARKTKAPELWAVELQKNSADRACRSVKANGLEGRIHICNCDVLDLTEKAAPENLEVPQQGAPSVQPGAPLSSLLPLRGSFDAVTSNPPYVERGAGLVCDNEAMQIARQESSAVMEDFFRAASAMLRRKGSLYLIQRPARLTDLLAQARKHQLEAKEIRFVRPKAGKEPNLVLIRYAKDGGKELHFLQDLIVYGEDGKYTEEVLAMYR